MTRPKKYIDSEHYRQMLVKDGERRFREWHSAFLKYQKDFVNQMSEIRYVRPPDKNGTSEEPSPQEAEPKDPFGLFG